MGIDAIMWRRQRVLWLRFLKLESEVAALRTPMSRPSVWRTVLRSMMPRNFRDWLDLSRAVGKFLKEHGTSLASIGGFLYQWLPNILRWLGL